MSVDTNSKARESDRLQAKFIDYKNRTRPRQRLERAAFTGSVALEGYAGIELINNTATPIAVLALLGGMGIAAGGILSRLDRTFKRGELKQAAERAKIAEDLADALPIIKPPYDLQDSYDALALEHRRAQMDSPSDYSGMLHSIWHSSGLRRLLEGYSMWSYQGEPQGIAGMTIEAYNAYDHTLNGSEFEQVMPATMFRALDEYFPIDQELDTVTPRDPDTGFASWSNYIKALHEDRPRAESIATLIGYPIEALSS